MMQFLVVYCRASGLFFVMTICWNFLAVLLLRSFKHALFGKILIISCLQVMNDAFGFSLRDDYKEGPYYRFLQSLSLKKPSLILTICSGTTEMCAEPSSSTCPLA